MHILSAEAQIFIPMAQPILSIFFSFLVFSKRKLSWPQQTQRGAAEQVSQDQTCPLGGEGDRLLEMWGGGSDSSSATFFQFLC